MDGATKEALNKWFDAFLEVKTERKIDTENIYNMDETGFAIGKLESTRIIVDSTCRTKYQSHPSRQEWVSNIECISADGRVLPPFVIFKGEQVNLG